MSKLDDILQEVSHNIAIGVVNNNWKKGDTKQEIKFLFIDLVLGADKNMKGDESSHELAELSGRKETIIELIQKVQEL